MHLCAQISKDFTIIIDTFFLSDLGLTRVQVESGDATSVECRWGEVARVTAGGRAASESGPTNMMITAVICGKMLGVYYLQFSWPGSALEIINSADEQKDTCTNSNVFRLFFGFIDSLMGQPG